MPTLALPRSVKIFRYNEIPEESTFENNAIYLNKSLEIVKSKIKDIRFEDNNLKLGITVVTNKEKLLESFKDKENDSEGFEYAGLSLMFCRSCLVYHYDKRVHKALKAHKLASDTTVKLNNLKQKNRQGQIPYEKRYKGKLALTQVKRQTKDEAGHFSINDNSPGATNYNVTFKNITKSRVKITKVWLQNKAQDISITISNGQNIGQISYWEGEEGVNPDKSSKLTISVKTKGPVSSIDSMIAVECVDTNKFPVQQETEVITLTVRKNTSKIRFDPSTYDTHPGDWEHVHVTPDPNPFNVSNPMISLESFTQSEKEMYWNIEECIARKIPLDQNMQDIMNTVREDLSEENYKAKTRHLIGLDIACSERNLKLAWGHIDSFDTKNNELVIRLKNEQRETLRIKPNDFVAIYGGGQQVTGKVRTGKDDKLYVSFESEICYVQMPQMSQVAVTNCSKTRAQLITKAVNEKLASNDIKYLFPIATTTTVPQNYAPFHYAARELNGEQEDTMKKIIHHTFDVPFLVNGAAGVGKSRLVTELVIKAYEKNETSLLTSPTNRNLHSTFERLMEINEERKFLHLKPLKICKIVSDNALVTEVCHKHCNLDENNIHINPTPEEIKAADVVLTTLHNASRLMSIASVEGTFNKKAHWVIIDEAGFSREQETIIPIATQLFIRKEENDLTPPKVVLMGDVKQLQYTSKGQSLNPRNKNKRIETNLLQRLKSLPVYQNGSINVTLKNNYRNPRNICNLLGKVYDQSEIIPMTESDAKIMCTHVDSSLILGVHSSSSFSKPAAIKAIELAKNTKDTTFIVCFYKAHELLLNSLLEKCGDDVRHIKTTCTEGYQGQEAKHIIVCPTMKRVPCQWVGDEPRVGMTLSRTMQSFHVVGNLFWLSRTTYFKEIVQYCLRNDTVQATEDTIEVLRGHLLEVLVLTK